jgi:uncharacterized membrane protein
MGQYGGRHAGSADGQRVGAVRNTLQGTDLRPASERKSQMDAGHLQSKKPRSPLAGSYGHPLHPLAVTLPIGAWVCSLVFDFVSYASAEPRVWSAGAMWLILLGVLGAALAAVLGVLDLLNLPRGSAAFNTGRLHAILNSTALVIFLIGFLWRFRTQDSWDASPVGPLVLSLVGIGVVSAGGFLGGKLAYHYGVRVADESVQAEGFTAPTTTGRT